MIWGCPLRSGTNGIIEILFHGVKNVHLSPPYTALVEPQKNNNQKTNKQKRACVNISHFNWPATSLKQINCKCKTFFRGVRFLCRLRERKKSLHTRKTKQHENKYYVVHNVHMRRAKFTAIVSFSQGQSKNKRYRSILLLQQNRQFCLDNMLVIQSLVHT